jgi:hypothetical protein
MLQRGWRTVQQERCSTSSSELSLNAAVAAVYMCVAYSIQLTTAQFFAACEALQLQAVTALYNVHCKLFIEHFQTHSSRTTHRSLHCTHCWPLQQ